MDIDNTNTPPPFMVIDSRHAVWAQLCGDQQAYDQLQGWLLEEGLDPQEVTRVEVYDTGGPVDDLALWAAVYDMKRERVAVGLARLPPMRVRMIVGVYPDPEKVTQSPKSDILFRNGQVDDPTPPFPPLSPRENPGAEDNASRAEFAFRTHAIAHGGVDQYGEPLYPWESLARCCRGAWETVAAALTAEIRAENSLPVDRALVAADSIALVVRALEELPTRCPYHGDATDPRGYPYPWTRQACCDSGLLAQRRKRAEGALEKLREAISG